MSSAGADVANDPARRAALGQFGQRSASGSPLDTLFSQFGQIEAQQILQILLDDLSAGVNPRQMASNLRGVLDDASYGRAATIARTETLHSWNDAALDNYRANSDVVGQWMWVCMPGAGTCVSCLEEDGSIYDLDEELDDHPNGRCCKGPVTRDYGDILSQYGIDTEGEDFGPGPWDDRETGEEWLLAQDAETQRAAFGSNAAFNAWRVGDVRLKDFVAVRHDAQWGSSIYQQSLRGMGLDARDYAAGTAKAAEAAQKAAAEVPGIGEGVAAEVGNRMGYQIMDDFGGGREALDRLTKRDLTNDEIGGLVGAQPGYLVSLSELESEGVHIVLSAPDYQDFHAERILFKDANGNLAMENVRIKIREPLQGQGLGAKVFGEEVQNLSRLGVDRIETGAAGNAAELALDPNSANGFYTWARFGYNTKLADLVDEGLDLDKLREAFPGVETLQDLMGQPGGPAWWKANGVSFRGTFDLHEGSISRVRLDAYLAEKGIVLEGLEPIEKAAAVASATAATTAEDALAAIKAQEKFYNDIFMAPGAPTWDDAADNIVARLGKGFDYQPLYDALDIKPSTIALIEGREGNAPAFAVRKMLEEYHTFLGGTSTGSPFQVFLQEAAQREFGVEVGLADVRIGSADMVSRALEQYGEALPEFQQVLRAMYDNTQEWFQERGITEVTLYRGESWTEALKPGKLTFDGEMRDVELTLKPLSSWSTNLSAASDFAQRHPTATEPIFAAIERATVPVGQILSVPGTGFGANYLDEMLVLGRTTDANILAIDTSTSKLAVDKVYDAFAEAEAKAATSAEESVPLGPLGTLDEIKAHEAQIEALYGGTMIGDPMTLQEAAFGNNPYGIGHALAHADEAVVATVQRSQQMLEEAIDKLATRLENNGAFMRFARYMGYSQDQVGTYLVSVDNAKRAEAAGRTLSEDEAKLAAMTREEAQAWAKQEALKSTVYDIFDAFHSIPAGGDELWVQTPLQIAMQEAVKSEFGLKTAAGYWSDEAIAASKAEWGTYRNGIRAFFRGMYDETQAYFQEQGITEVQLFRGLRWTEDKAPAGIAFDGHVIQSVVDGAPMTSWASNAEVALDYARDVGGTARPATEAADVGMMLATKVPVSQILSTPFTGFGTPTLREMILLGKPDTALALPFQMERAPTLDSFLQQLAGREEGFAVRAVGEGVGGEVLPSEASVHEAFAQRAIEGIGDNPRITYRATIEGQDYFVKKLPYMSSEARERGGVALLQHLGDDYVLPTAYGTLADDTPYLIQPWTGGKTLESVNDAASVLQALPVEDRARLTVVDYLLGQGDKGLANYLVLPDGSVRLTDFEFLGDAHSSRLDLTAPLVRDAYGATPLSVIPIPRDLLDAIQAQRDALVADAQSARLSYDGSQGFQQRLDILDRLAALDHPTLADLQRLGDEAVSGGLVRATAPPPADMSWLPPTTERTPKPGSRGLMPQGHFDPYQAKVDFGKDFDQLLAAQTQASLNQGVRAVQYYNPGEVPAGRTNADKVAFIKRFVSPEEGFAVRAVGEGVGGEAAQSALRAQIERLDPQANVQEAATWLKQQIPGAQHVIFSGLDDEASARVIANGVANLADALPRVSRNLWRVEASDAVQGLMQQEAWAFATADGRALLLNPLAWNDLERMATLAPQYASNGWWITQTPEQLIGHEFGHLVQINYHISNAEWVAAEDRVGAAGGTVFVSQYAKYMTQESFAEVFTLLIYGDPTEAELPIAREMAQLLYDRGIDYNAVRASVGSAPLDLAG